MIGNGLRIEGTSYASPYLCDVDGKSGRFLDGIKWKDVHVLLLQGKLTGAADFNQLFQDLFNNDVKEIVVFCDDYEVPAVSDFVRTRAMRGFKTFIISRCPSFSGMNGGKTFQWQAVGKLSEPLQV